MARFVVRVASNALLVSLFVVAALAGAIAGVVFVFVGDLPQISALDDYAPNTITRVYAADNSVVGEFATERRVVIGYHQISPRLRQAIISAEDQEFDEHFGLSIPRIAIALMKDIAERRKAAGASTLTQQLAKNLFLTPDKTWERKIKEALLAIQIEKRYTKREILTLYANQIYFGHGAYGVEAASRLYFGKSANDLDVEEAALIAGIIQSPSRQSPYVNYDVALRRRNYALTRMAEDGYITADALKTALASPITTAGLPEGPDSVAPYFVEEVRKHLEARFGAKQLYEHGLSVRTALDRRLQEVANRAVDRGLRGLDRRRGWRKPARTVQDTGKTLATYAHPRWRRGLAVDEVVPAVVVKATPAEMTVRIGERTATIGREGFAWTRRARATDLAKPGDVVEVRVVSIDEATGTLKLALDQEPLVEGALVALDNRTGRIIAMVGGHDFARSKFNRATQAYRQLGSTFKPILYTAAIDRGFTPASVLVDAPVSYAAGPGQPPYQPSNYDNRFYGPMSLRRAIEQSRNVPAVRLMNALGPKQVIAYARRFGLKGNLAPYLSLALGASEATLLETTAAFSVFPNQGVRMTPHLVLKVTDREGSVLEENRPEPTDAVRADTAYVMTSLLQGVVERGTAARAASLEWPLGGKTGTTNDFTDAWFVGFDPDITVGVWVGHDQKKTLGPSESGGVAALPIWIEFMKAWIGDRKERPEFGQPGNILFVDVSPGGGAEGEPPATRKEVFISGTQPGSGFERQ